MQILSLYSRPTESETLGRNPAICALTSPQMSLMLAQAQESLIEGILQQAFIYSTDICLQSNKC